MLNLVQGSLKCFLCDFFPPYLIVAWKLKDISTFEYASYLKYRCKYNHGLTLFVTN
jgi:hypothetical protein